jgi:hypothetical protein
VSDASKRTHRHERKRRGEARAERQRAADAAAAAEAKAAADAEAAAMARAAAIAEARRVAIEGQGMENSRPAPAASPGNGAGLPAVSDSAATTGTADTGGESPEPGQAGGRVPLPSLRPALTPPRDTGLTVRKRSPHRHSADPWLWPMVAIIGVLLVAASVATYATKRPAPTAAVVAPPVANAVPVGAVSEMHVASPAFARYKGMLIHLPVAPESVTAVAFHQASFSDVLKMISLVREQSLGAAIKAGKRRAWLAKTRGATASAEATPAPMQTDNGVWTGQAVRVWRSGRPGQPDTAADVGAKPGTRVLSPVAGRVILVERYKLYNKYDDYKIHIQPTGFTDIDVIVMHVTNPAVTSGQVLEAGVTPLAKVRCLSKYAPLQLRSYSGDKGDHVHVQVNLITPRLGIKPLLGGIEEPDGAERAREK